MVMSLAFCGCFVREHFPGEQQIPAFSTGQVDGTRRGVKAAKNAEKDRQSSQKADGTACDFRAGDRNP